MSERIFNANMLVKLECTIDWYNTVIITNAECNDNLNEQILTEKDTVTQNNETDGLWDDIDDEVDEYYSLENMSNATLSAIKPSLLIKDVCEASTNILSLWESVKSKLNLMMINKKQTLLDEFDKHIFEFYTGDTHLDTYAFAQNEWKYKKNK